MRFCESFAPNGSGPQAGLRAETPYLGSEESCAGRRRTKCPTSRLRIIPLSSRAWCARGDTQIRNALRILLHLAPRVQVLALADFPAGSRGQGLDVRQTMLARIGSAKMASSVIRCLPLGAHSITLQYHQAARYECCASPRRSGLRWRQNPRRGRGQGCRSGLPYHQKWSSAQW
jgi:hypothetical protein